MIYEKNTLEFVTIALEFCALMETTDKHTLFSFTDKAVKILPLLYLKATLLPVSGQPDIDSETDDENSDLEQFISEETYEVIRQRLSDLLGEFDPFLETFHPDIQFSDTPVVATISEQLADVYQDIGNFAALFRQENEQVMKQALVACEVNFRLYWGQKLLNALKALHLVRFQDDLSLFEDN